MAGERTIYFLHGIATILIMTATVSLMGAIFTDYWLVSSVGGTGFHNAGLWKACFYKYKVNNNYNLYSVNPLALSGCYSVDSTIFDDYQSWINPSWLKAVKGLLVSCMFTNVGCLFFCAFLLLQSRDVYIIPINIINLVSVTLFSAGMTIYHYMSTDRDYLPLPDSNEFSSSYTAAVCALFIMLVAACLHLIQGLLVYCGRDKSMSKY